MGWKLKPVETQNLLAVDKLTKGTIRALKGLIGKLDMSNLSESDRAQIQALYADLRKACPGYPDVLARPSFCEEWTGPIQSFKVLTENPKRR